MPYIEDTVSGLREQVGDEKVLLALSAARLSVVAALLQKAIDDRTGLLFVNTGCCARVSGNRSLVSSG